jgi:hypothetical protein
MRASIDLRPTRLLLGAGALALAFAIGAGVASGGAHAAAAPAAPALAADDTTAASSALGLGDDTSLVASVGQDGTVDAQSAAAPKGAGILRAIIGRTQRAEITVSTAAGEKTLLFVRGSFSAASSTSVTVTLKDGTTAVFALDASTTVRSAGKAKAIADIKTTGHGIVIGLKNADGTFTAKFVRIAPAK